MHVLPKWEQGPSCSVNLCSVRVDLLIILQKVRNKKTRIATVRAKLMEFRISQETNIWVRLRAFSLGNLSLVDGGTPTLSLGTIPWPRVPGWTQRNKASGVQGIHPSSCFLTTLPICQQLLLLLPWGLYSQTESQFAKYLVRASRKVTTDKHICIYIIFPHIRRVVYLLHGYPHCCVETDMFRPMSK